MIPGAPAPPSEPEGDSPEPSTDQPAQSPAPVPFLELSEPLPEVINTEAGMEQVARSIRAGSGPVAIDAERASGYRYSSRAYLIQVRREGSGTSLVDPIGIDDFAPMVEALSEVEWILHAASQDLPCLAELGLRPDRLFDTELAGRLLGYPRVGLATLVEELLGRRLRKEHSAVDWSTRPLPEPWLEYAALDVEPLVALRDALHRQLVADGKWEWARQEFEHLVSAPAAAPRTEPWRRTSGLHKVRGRRALASVRALWEARDQIAAERDVTPGKIIPDSAIVVAASAQPRDRGALLATKGFTGRGARRYAASWVDALRAARALPESDLPAPGSRHGDGPPPARTWAERDPVAAARLTQARAAVNELSERLDVPPENLLTPDYLRRVLWEPPAEPGAEPVAEALRRLGARAWQVELTADLIAEAVAAHR